MIYKCNYCYTYYGTHAEAPELVPLPIETITRYADCDLWQCPHCRQRQDSRSITSFLGSKGGNSVSVVTIETYQQTMFMGKLMRMHYKR